MKNKILTICLIVVLAVTSLGVSVSSKTPSVADVVRRVQALPIFKAAKWEVHLRTPNVDQTQTLLEEQGIPLNNPEIREQAIQAFQSEWAKRNPATPNPQKLAALLKKEQQGTLDASAQPGASVQAGVTAQPQIMSLAVPMEFPNSDTFIWCGDTVTTTGPLHNQIPPPGPRDNNTIWYDDATPALYNELYFGVGPNAGVIVNHPNLGTLDFRGDTMANYYLEQSEGKFQPKGEVYPKWLQAAHSEGWYGADGCSGANVTSSVWKLVEEAIAAVNADNPTFAWENYDGDGNGVVDNFTVLHAGMGQEAGGGQQGAFSIWSHAWFVDPPTGVLACTKGSAGCPDRDIYVQDYSMDPENIDVGVISEEFGHAAFGLPDIYTTDAQASVSNWAIMEAGSWNGSLGGMQPAPFPLFFRYLVGWAKPVEVNYDTTKPVYSMVGQLSQRPKGTQQGIKINLPDTQVVVANRAGSGKGWWSTLADSSEFYLAHDFDLTGTTAPIFSFDTYWSIEQDYDYGYFEVSTDGGATWTLLQDTDGFMTNTNPNGTNQGWGLTSEGSGTIHFDLSAYAGQKVSVRLLYSTDSGTQWDGWWADNFKLADGATTLFSDDAETTNGWTTNAWVSVPLTQTFPLYYLAEWRNLSGFDKGLTTPYTTVYDNPATTEWQVDRCPYTVPGMLLYLRNAYYKFDYTLYDSIYDPPSYGPKHALLVVDSHYWPLEWDGMGTSDAHLRLNSRCQPGNATFTLQGTTPFTVDRGEVDASGNYTGNILETKTFDSLPPVSQFHDALGYYPGLRFRPANNALYFWDAPASAVLATTGSYTTKITDGDKQPLTDLYGVDLGDTILGTGDPRDNGVQYGVNIAVLNKAKNGSWGNIVVWNAKTLVKLDVKANVAKAFPRQPIYYLLKVQNTSPAPEKFAVSDPIPANTHFVFGKFYNSGTNSIEWSGTLKAHESKVIGFWVAVDKDTPPGTVITNTATLVDDGAGSTASATTTVVSRR